MSETVINSLTVEQEYEDFLRDDFTVDDYIKNFSSLEQLRQDLGGYLKKCRLRLIDLINENYAGFVTLADRMVGLDSGIKKLIIPLETLKAKVNKIEKQYTTIIDDVTGKMYQIKSIQREREELESIINIIDTLVKLEKIGDELAVNQSSDKKFNIYKIERLAIQTSEIMNILQSASKNLPYVNNQLIYRCKDLSKKTNKILEATFDQSLITSNDLYLQKLYKIHAINGQLDHLERLLLSKIRPYFISILSDSILETNGVEKYFADLKRQLVNRLRVFINLDEECRKWYISRILSQLVETISVQSPSLFASGHPDQFHSNYLACLQFIKSIREELDVAGSTFDSKYFTLLTQKFNIEIYFRIRFQEIASNFEQSLKQSYTYQPRGKQKFEVKPLKVLPESIRKFWCREKVYLEPLFASFWKLTLQLISRCAIWLQTIEHSHLEISNVSSQDSARLKSSLLSAIFSQTENTIKGIRKIFDSLVLPLKPTQISESELRDSLEEGLLSITETGLPNIIKLTKECLVKRT